MNLRLLGFSGSILLCCIPLFGAEPVFPSATPESCGVRSDRLREMSEWIRKEQLDVRAMIVLKNEKLILEWLAEGVSRDHNHNVFSVTKSVVATMTGIALKEKKFQDLDVPLGNYFALAAKPETSAVTIRNLLMMQSGFPVSRANQTKGSERELFDQLNSAPDRTGAAFNLSLTAVPGSSFAYNNIDPQLMVSVIELIYRKKALDMADEKLFGPMGFQNVEWVYADNTGAVPGGYGLRLRAIDLAKLGQLYLQNGVWNGNQLLPKSFVLEATSDQTKTGYGYYWWCSQRADSQGAFAAKGVRGQQVFVDPARELVFVVTADLPPAQVKALLKSMTSKILAAIAEDTPLREDTVKTNALRRELALAAQYSPKQRSQAPRARQPRTPDSK